MRQNIRTRGTSSEKAVKDIRRANRKQYSAEEKIRIVLDGLRGEETIAELCRQEGIAQSLYYGTLASAQPAMAFSSIKARFAWAGVVFMFKNLYMTNLLRFTQTQPAT